MQLFISFLVSAYSSFYQNPITFGSKELIVLNNEVILRDNIQTYSGMQKSMRSKKPSYLEIVRGFLIVIDNY
jgi:hypothetical protein